MGTSKVTYMFDNTISIEASGFYWEYDSHSDFYIDQNTYEGLNNDENRYGAIVILKQADNVFNLQWFLGYSYDNQDIKLLSREYRTLAEQIIIDSREQPQSGWSRHVNSVFGQLKWGAVKDKLYFLAGGRGDDYSNQDIQVTPRCGIIFLPTENSSVKALYGRAFMAPNALNHFGSENILSGNPDLSPETIDVYELIYMYREKNWRFSANGFYSLWNDGIILKYNQDASIYLQVNEGESRSYGGEMNLFYSMDAIAVEMGGAYVKSMAVNSINLETLEKEDQGYGMFPEYSINIGLYYTLRPMDINFYVNNRIYLNMKDTESQINPDAASLPAYYRLDINISRKFSDNLEMILDIRNALNRKNYIPGPIGTINGYEEPGTSVLLRMVYAF